MPAELKQVNVNAAGIDVGATVHFVCVPEGRDPQPVRSFGAFTADLEALADWLGQCGVTTVAMEATGVYWIPLFELLEQRGFEVRLVEPSRLKHVPGRKSDVLDCQWIQQLHTFGLLSGSFRPEDSICILRSYVRQRHTLVRSAGRCIQHMEKALTQMNVKLQHVISDITGVTGMAILEAILAGERDPQKLAQLRHERCKNDEATIALALQGNWREDHLFALKQAVDTYRFFHEKLAEVEREDRDAIEDLREQEPGQAAGSPPFATQARGQCAGLRCAAVRLYYDRRGPHRGGRPGGQHHPHRDFRNRAGHEPLADGEAFRLLANPLSRRQQDGGTLAEQQRTDAAEFQPHRRRAAGRRSCPLACGLRLGAYAQRMRSRLGAPKAITATAHKLAIIIYNMLKHGKAYVDRGADYYEQQYHAAMVKNLKRRARQLGFELLEASALPAPPPP